MMATIKNLSVDQRKHIAIIIAIVVHFFGVLGMLSPYAAWFKAATPLNLLLMLALVIFTQVQKNKSFWLFMFIAFATGMITEMIGVNTGLLFGDYHYGNVLGPKLYGVPFLIGVNWFVTVYAATTISVWMHQYITNKYETIGVVFNKHLMLLMGVLDAAFITVAFDYIMEPAAIQLGMWQWHTADIPMFNYTCWYVISALLAAVMFKLQLRQTNHFVIHLLFIEALFFIAIRLFS